MHRKIGQQDWSARAVSVIRVSGGPASSGRGSPMQKGTLETLVQRTAVSRRPRRANARYHGDRYEPAV